MHGVRIVDVSNESKSKITTKYPKIVTLRSFIPYSITSYKVWLVGELNEIKTVSLKLMGPCTEKETCSKWNKYQSNYTTGY